MAHRSQESWSRSVNCKRTQLGTPVPAFSLHSYLLSPISPFGIIYLCQPSVYFGGERSQRELSSSDSLRNSLYKPQAQSPKPKARSSPPPGLPHGWRECRHPSHHHCLSGPALAGSCIKSWSLVSNTGPRTRSVTTCVPPTGPCACPALWLRWRPTHHILAADWGSLHCWAVR